MRVGTRDDPVERDRSDELGDRASGFGCRRGVRQQVDDRCDSGATVGLVLELGTNTQGLAHVLLMDPAPDPVGPAVPVVSLDDDRPFLAEGLD